MTLIDESEAEALYSAMGQTTEVSGGSVANSVAGIASLGGKPAFLGRVRNDELGTIFTHDLNGVGVHFEPTPATDGKRTARCFVLVTPDAERSMLTYLGACTEFAEDDVDEELIKQSEIIYIEGYLWDQPNAIKAIRKAITVAKENGVKVAFTLSDPFCVSRHLEEFDKAMPLFDILFCNEEEAKMLFGVQNSEDAIEKAKGLDTLVVMTIGSKGAAVIEKGNATIVATDNVDKLIDTTGAGDLFAAGFLYGYTNGKSLEESAKIGNKAAGQIIQQLGARPQKPLKELAA